MQFSLDLFKTVFNSGKTASGKKENLFVSPMSIYSSLLLAYFGSNNRTEEQLAQVLGFKDMDKVKCTKGKCTFSSIICFLRKGKCGVISKLKRVIG